LILFSRSIRETQFEEFKTLFEQFKEGYNEYLYLKKEQKIQEKLNIMEGDF